MPSPNTNFSVGELFTSVAANNFPRGVMALTVFTTNLTYLNAETTRAQATFTAEANRNYKITFFDPDRINVNARVDTTVFRLDTTGGTVLGTTVEFFGANVNAQCVLTIVTTLTAGARTIIARASTNAATGTTSNASATKPGYLLIEDIGPA